MAVDYEYNKTRDSYAPFSRLLTVTPSDTTEYDPPLRGVIVAAAGDLVVETEKGDAAVTITVFARQLIPAIITKLKAATDATVIGGR